MRLPIVFYSFYALFHDVVSFSEQVAQEPAVWAQADVGTIIATLARVSQWMFVALLAVLPLFRHRPIAKSTALLPRLAALFPGVAPNTMTLTSSDAGPQRAIEGRVGFVMAHRQFIRISTLSPRFFVAAASVGSKSSRASAFRFVAA